VRALKGVLKINLLPPTGGFGVIALAIMNTIENYKCVNKQIDFS
jgi:hypothetical protein